MKLLSAAALALFLTAASALAAVANTIPKPTLVPDNNAFVDGTEWAGIPRIRDAIGDLVVVVQNLTILLADEAALTEQAASAKSDTVPAN